MDDNNNTNLNDWMKLQHLNNLAGAYAICLVIYWFISRRRRRKNNQESDALRDFVRDVMSNRVICCEMIRMGPEAFSKLCGILQDEGGLKSTEEVTIEEKVLKSLYMLGHNVTTREIGIIFGRSTKSVNRHFHEFLNAVIELEEKYIKQPDGTEIPAEILKDNQFHPYFKDCIGVIDGTHIRVKVRRRDYPKYRGRKDYPTQNVLAACSFDLKFTYVLTGWEGTAPDSRILKNALRREDPEAKEWRNKPIYNYNKLAEIWATDRATGDQSATAREMRTRGVSNSIDDLDEIVARNEAVLENFDQNPHESQPPMQSATEAIRSINKRGKVSKDTKVVVDSLRMVADAIVTSSREFVASQRCGGMDEGEIWDHLQELGFFGVDLQSAYRFLTKHLDRMRALLKVPKEEQSLLLRDIHCIISSSSSNAAILSGWSSRQLFGEVDCSF